MARYASLAGQLSQSGSGFRERVLIANMHRGEPPRAMLWHMDVPTKLESMLSDARMALAAFGKGDRSVAALVDRVGALRYSEGVLVGSLEALVSTDPESARIAAPRIEAFIGEAIAARILLD